MFNGLFIASIFGTIAEAVKEACEPTVHVEKPKHPEPHRGRDGKIMIENCLLYEKDLERYDVYQVGQWVRQGKYNLSPEEAQKERERIDREWEERMNKYCK